jgi:gliding motility-associated protein GldE
LESSSLITPAITPLLYITTETGTALGLLILLLLFISFCASGAEVAFFSLSYKDINHLKTKPQPSYRRIVTLLETPKVLLGVLMIANSFANIGIIIVSNHLLDKFLLINNEWLLLAAKIFIVAAVILLFGEILPKTFAAQNNMRFAKDVGIIVEGLYLLFNRLAIILVGFSDSIEKKIGQRTAAASIEELNHAIDLTSEEDATVEERNILKGILKFGNITVKQVMKARLDVSGLEFKSNFATIKHQVEDLHYSRLPVYHVSLDEVKGIIHTRDLLQYLHEPDDFDWHQLMRPAHFVHEQKLIEDLMQEFQAKRVHFAVVVDEFGGTSGIITMEDILEEIIGEITDEFDDEESGNKKIDDLNYLFEGKTMLNDVCRIMNLSPDTFDEVKGESDSLAGLILEVAGEIPTVNKVINVGDFDFTIMEVAKNRIQKIKVSIRPSAN